MKRMFSLCAAALSSDLALTPTALARTLSLRHRTPLFVTATAIVRGDDGSGTEKNSDDLSPRRRSCRYSPAPDFRQDGFHYTPDGPSGNRSFRKMRAASTQSTFPLKAPKKTWNLCWHCCRRSGNSSRMTGLWEP